MEVKGYIYILTNPSFPNLVKIGYAKDVERRVKELNRSSCIPFSFRIYGYYKVNTELSDKALHNIIDKINPDLRAIEPQEGNRKERKREFYEMSPEDAFSILEGIAQIHGLESNLVRVAKTRIDIEEEKQAKEIEDYSEEKFINSNPNMKELYLTLKNRILELGSVVVEPKKLYIAYKRNTNFCDILFRKNKIVIFINLSKGKLNDPENRCEDISVKGHWGNGDYAINIYAEADFEYVIGLIEQSYGAN